MKAPRTPKTNTMKKSFPFIVSPSATAFSSCSLNFSPATEVVWSAKRYTTAIAIVIAAPPRTNLEMACEGVSVMSDPGFTRKNQKIF